MLLDLIWHEFNFSIWIGYNYYTKLIFQKYFILLGCVNTMFIIIHKLMLKTFTFFYKIKLIYLNFYKL